MAEWRRMQRAFQAARTRRERAPLPAPDYVRRREASRGMAGIALVLFFLPFVNGVIAGVWGGLRLGSAREALRAEIIPGLAWATAAVLVLGIVLTQFLGYWTIAPAFWLLLTALGLVPGAALGGALASARSRRHAEV